MVNEVMEGHRDRGEAVASWNRQRQKKRVENRVGEGKRIAQEIRKNKAKQDFFFSIV